MEQKIFAVIWLKAAAQDLEDIWNYINSRSPAYASGMIGRIVQAVENLGHFPLMGHRVPDMKIKDVELREWVVHPYRIIYRVRDERVIILAVVHGARLLRRVMRGRPLN